MNVRTRLLLGMMGLLVSACQVVVAQDENFHIFLCFGQSNMEGFPGLEERDKEGVDERFQVLAAVDFPALDREEGKWYLAVPPLSRPGAGLGPADHFGRTLVSSLPQQVRVGVINVSVAGCRIELFGKETYQAYAKDAPGWMKGIIDAYGGNPYERLITMARQAQQRGVIKGILLHQGESNNNDEEWPLKVRSVYENLLADLGLTAGNVPLLAGEVVHQDQGGACAAMNRIIGRLPEVIPTAHVVSSAGCEARRDRLHFSAAGYRELGRRYAATVLPLLQAAPAPAAGTQPDRGPKDTGKVLVFSGTGWYRHPETAAISGWLARLSEDLGMQVDVTETPRDLSSLLDRYGVLVLNNSNELTSLLNDEERSKIEEWYKSGGGIVALHAALVRQKEWRWFNELAGCDFNSDSEFLEARVVVDPAAKGHPAVQGVGETFLYKADWTNHDRTVTGLPGFQVLLRVDEASYEPVRDYFRERGGMAMGNDHPIAWTNTLNGGRFFYTELGHDVRSLETPFGRRHIVEAIRWAARDSN